MHRLRFSVIMLAVVLVVAGCGNGDSGPTSSKAPVPAETVKGTTSTIPAATTTAADAKTPEGSGDNVYVGGVSATGPGAEFAEVLESHVEVRITDGTAQMMIDMTFEAVWVAGDENNEPCVSTNRWVLSGTGPAAPTMNVDLFVDLYDVLAVSGCEMDPENEDEDEAMPFAGSVSNGTVTGTFFNDLFLLTAEHR